MAESFYNFVRKEKFRRGSDVDGYTFDNLVVAERTSGRLASQNSPRTLGGALQLRENLLSNIREYNIFHPEAIFQTYNSFRDGNWVLVRAVYYEYPTRWTVINSHWDPLKEPDPGEDALSKLYAALNKNKVNMSLMFAERQKAVNMAAKKLVMVFKAYRSVRKGQFKRAGYELGLRNPRKARSKQAAEQWLELQYGWRPLISDVYKLLDFQPFSAGYTFGRASAFSSYKASRGVQVTYHRRSQYLTHASVEDEGAAYASKCGLTNPALLAWELLPYSFVIDWALPISSYLNALDSRIGMSFHDTSYSTTVTRNTVLDGKSSLLVSSSHTRFERTPLPRLPLPSISLKNPISLTHIANALALGRNLRK